MPTRKIGDLPATIAQPCRHREHYPPMHMVYLCPGCGARQTFTVRPTLAADDSVNRDPEPLDHFHAIRLARSIAGGDGSKWHDIDQRLARAVLRRETRMDPDDELAYIEACRRVLADRKES